MVLLPLPRYHLGRGVIFLAAAPRICPKHKAGRASTCRQGAAPNAPTRAAELRLWVGALCDHAYVSPKTYVEVWPTQGEAIYGRFHVQLLSEEPGAGFTVWTLALTNRQQVNSLCKLSQAHAVLPLLHEASGLLLCPTRCLSSFLAQEGCGGSPVLATGGLAHEAASSPEPCHHHQPAGEGGDAPAAEPGWTHPRHLLVRKIFWRSSPWPYPSKQLTAPTSARVKGGHEFFWLVGHQEM